MQTQRTDKPAFNVCVADGGVVKCGEDQELTHLLSIFRP